MKRTLLAPAVAFPLIAVLAAISAASCASSPAKPAEIADVPIAVPEKVRKERVETTRTPLLATETSYAEDGILDKITTWTFNDDKSLVLQKTVTRPSVPEPEERYAYEYAGTKLRSLSIFDSDGKLRSKTSYDYDAASRLAKETLADETGQTRSVSSYEYDQAGLKKAWRVFNDSGILVAATTYVYTDKNASTIELRNGADKLLGTIEQAFDASGETSRKTYKDADGAVETIETFIRKDGFLLEERRERGNGRLERRIVYEPGEGGVPVKASISDGSGRVREILIREYAWKTTKLIIEYYE